MKIEAKKIELEIDVNDFKKQFGRFPSPDEFDQFCNLCEEAFIKYGDWNVVFKAAKYEIEHKEELKELLRAIYWLLDVAEEHYPNYTGCDKIAEINDLIKKYDDIMENIQTRGNKDE